MKTILHTLHNYNINKWFITKHYDNSCKSISEIYIIVNYVSNRWDFNLFLNISTDGDCRICSGIPLHNFGAILAYALSTQLVLVLVQIIEIVSWLNVGFFKRNMKVLNLIKIPWWGIMKSFVINKIFNKLFF